MIAELTKTLKAILSASDVPAGIADADIAFERPGDTYTPQATTINLFLYDLRENTELRSNEPVIERQDGIAKLRRPPLRADCSYLVTVWVGADLSGEEAMLKQHELLGEVLQMFAGLPALPAGLLSASMAAQPYPVPLVALRTELVRNPAEFWSALGGKLRPSFTLTATIAIEQTTSPVTAFEVSTRKILFRETELQIEETLLQLGGTVRIADTEEVIPDVLITLLELGRQTRSDSEGRFKLSVPAADEWTLSASKPGFSDFTAAVEVPGNSPTAFDIEMTELT